MINAKWFTLDRWCSVGIGDGDRQKMLTGAALWQTILKITLVAIGGECVLEVRTEEICESLYQSDVEYAIWLERVHLL